MEKKPTCSETSRRAIEKSFPFEEISRVAKLESWRKEVYRPIYYVHKWWAKRLGSVFRAIILGACASEDENILELFYRSTEFPNLTVYDPMMGSGVTIGEAKKLNCKVIGRDINPVSYLLVKGFMNDYSISQINRTYEDIREDVADVMKSYYKTVAEDDEKVDVLYYFWVKILECPNCAHKIDLFETRIFSSHAYPVKNPLAKSLCPHCGAVNSVLISDTETECDICHTRYNPQKGSVNRNGVVCSECGKTFAIIDALKSQELPLKHRMYSKLILTSDGDKEYHPINEYDLQLYEEAITDLKKNNLRIPQIRIQSGYNTDQILNYGYEFWHQLFNDRQLLCLGILGNRIRQIEDESVRELFTCLFSGCLEFNNMFSSFKGEGTGAVRPMFSHHILKPERTPLEANIWGTSKSSGSFSTLFRSRITRALDYKENPFELRIDPKTNNALRMFEINHKVSGKVVSSFSEFKRKEGSAYLSCGSSDKTDIEDAIVDVIVTDPPFFANVQYSELADFFYVWQRQIIDGKIFNSETTRSEKEIQQVDADKFADRLAAVFGDCYRVLKHNGLMVFTFNQAQPKGWAAILTSLRKSGFCVQTFYPVKSEMSVAVPKSQAKNPIDLDMIIVCRKADETVFLDRIPDGLLDHCAMTTKEYVEKFNSIDERLSQNDIKGILLASIIKTLSSVKDHESSLSFLSSKQDQMGKLAGEIERGK